MASQIVCWTAFVLLLSGSCFGRTTERDLSNIRPDLPTPSTTDKEFLPKMLSFVFNVLDIKEVVNEVKLGKTSTATCMACKFGMSMLQDFVESGKTEDDIANIVISVCKTMKLFSNVVCEGTVHNFKDQIVYVLSQVVLSSDEICGFLLGPTCATAFNPLHNWTLPLPDVPKPPLQPVQPPKPGSPTLKVLHLTDLHYDPYYVEGMNAACGDPLCCRKMNGPPAKPSDAAGRWGDYRACDTPYETLDNILQHISKEYKLDYIMWTGDIPPHDHWNNSRSEVLALIEATTDLIRKYFPDTPVYPSVGNHEGEPVNSFPPLDAEPRFSPSWLYNAMVNAWGPWLPKEAAVTLAKGGFYSTKVKKGLRIIAVNSNFCNSFNYWLFLNSTDPSQHLQWLIQELLQAEQNNDMVHIISHIPPGKYDCLKSWSETFNKIINRFEGTVRGQFYGHTHQDEFEVFYETDGRPTNVAYISPSVTTYGGVNPAFRIFTIDGSYPGSSFAVLDHESYYLNLTSANAGGPVEWVKAYSAKDDYRMDSLQPTEWNKLIDRLEKDEDVFQKFYRHYNMQSDFPHPPCIDNCKAEMICALRTSRSNDLSWCNHGALNVFKDQEL